MIASYNAIITFSEVIIVGGIVAGGRLNLKMATSPFTEEVTKMIEENTIWKSTKDVTKFGEILFQRKI